MALRLASLALCVLLVASSAAAVEVPPPGQMAHRGECIRLTNQMVRYARDAGWAEDRGNDMWRDASLAQLGRLSARRDHLCPWMRQDPLKEFKEWLGKALRVAAKAAYKYFTGQWW